MCKEFIRSILKGEKEYEYYKRSKEITFKSMKITNK